MTPLNTKSHCLAIAFIAIMLMLGYFSGKSNLVDHSIGAVVEEGR